MNQPAFTTGFIPNLIQDLSGFVVVCEELLNLATQEHQTLTATGNFDPADYSHGRKDLLARLDTCLNSIKHWRQIWQQSNPAGQSGYVQVKMLFQALQDLIVKILQLDRENQQALLRRGLLPARAVPAFAGQQPNYVSNLYRRHTAA